MKTFKYENREFVKHNIAEIFLFDLQEGPYTIVFPQTDKSDFPLDTCYCGADDRMQNELYKAGKWVVSISDLIDHMIHYCRYHNKDITEDIHGMTFHGLCSAVRDCHEIAKEAA